MKTGHVVLVSICILLCAPLCGAYCGDGIVESDEQCDDGNSSNSDGCSVTCRVECQNDPDCPSGLVCGMDNQCGECAAHCDCSQGQFCYYGTCITDPMMPVYCCTNPGCPPGHWCLNSDNTQGTCAEDPLYYCESACDCGPAHCCKNNICVKDVNDPWSPGGTEVGPPCIQGVDGTYCCTDPACHAGRNAYGDQFEDFLCDNEITGLPQTYCGGRECYSACQCEPGESCFDTKTIPSPPVGKICRPEGGFCISNATAEAVYGWSPSDLLPCCDQGCWPGEQCVVGWRTDGRYTSSRIVGVCGGSCGNGSCDPGESASSCPADCGLSCGDGECFPEEMPGGDYPCPADCVSTSPCQVPPPNYGFQMCGDGVCQHTGYIPEDCVNCALDCDAVNDTDGDGTADGCDLCPLDSNKTEPGDCGCNIADLDTDDDGISDCIDGCPNDGNKTEPGICGCGVADEDSDGDATLDCEDGCPYNPTKVEPGVCGCAVDDIDTDGDGTMDCVDGCPNDPNKVDPGVCGCGQSDGDADNDGLADCVDDCPLDPFNDADSDGLCGDVDQCPNSDLSPTVVISGCDSGAANHLLEGGCTILDGIWSCAAGASNHGEFVSCVSHLTNTLKAAGVISGLEKDSIQSCAAEASIP